MIPKDTKLDASGQRPTPNDLGLPDPSDKRYHLFNQKGEIVATSVRVGKGKQLKVLAGSKVRVPKERLRKAFRTTYDALVACGNIVDGALTRDHIFSAPSHAFSVIIGDTAGGVRGWRTKKKGGQTLSSVLDAEAALFGGPIEWEQTRQYRKTPN
jgi:hypothetical protein